jgi:S-formylglutathione hydrolase
MAITPISQHPCFGGTVGFYRHYSSACAGEMRFSVYLPPLQIGSSSSPAGSQASLARPVLYFLSGLTCTEENFMVKAGAQQFAAAAGLILVAPDTSPRNTGIPGEDDDWDFGTGAGFYLNATVAPWSRHYRMYDYVVNELPAVIQANFPVLPERQGICGHSMGGHGALVCALRNPERYRSVSAFAPIAAPSQIAWGEKAFSRYLGENRADWLAYDASALVSSHPFATEILIDQGLADPFLGNQLLPERFEQACAQVGQSLNLRRHPGYDHGYYFIATFIADHIRHHAQYLVD